MEEMSIKERMLKALSVTNEAEFAQIIEGIHPADMAEVLEVFNCRRTFSIFRKDKSRVSCRRFVEFDEEERGELLRLFSEEIAQELVGNMDRMMRPTCCLATRRANSRGSLKVEDVEQAKNSPTAYS